MLCAVDSAAAIDHQLATLLGWPTHVWQPEPSPELRAATPLRLAAGRMRACQFISWCKHASSRRCSASALLHAPLVHGGSPLLWVSRAGPPACACRSLDVMVRDLVLWFASRDVHISATFARNFYWSDLNL